MILAIRGGIGGAKARLVVHGGRGKDATSGPEKGGGDLVEPGGDPDRELVGVDQEVRDVRFRPDLAVPAPAG